MKARLIHIAEFIRSELFRFLSVAGIIGFAILPLVTLAFHVQQSDWEFMMNDTKFWTAVQNSLYYTTISAIITTFLALVAAYLLNEASIKWKNSVVVLLTLGMLVPTISVGLGLRVFFGAKGFLDLFGGLRIEVRGFPGLIIGSVITSFPATFLILYDALRYEDKGPYDAANIMGIGRVSTFFKLKIPYLKVAIVSAFFACFTLVFSDYGIPMEIAGKVKTLPMYIYDQFMSSFKYGRGSIAGFILLVPSVISFVFDVVFKDSSVNEKQKRRIKTGKAFNIFTCIISVILCLLLFMPQFAFISLAFTKSFPNDLSFSFEHVANIFNNTHGVGLTAYINNSLVLAVGTGICGVVFAYMLAYFSVRKQGKMGKAIDLLALSTIAIPGLVLGIGYIFLFSNTNGAFYGTILILIIVNIFHFLGSPYLLAKNCLSKINREYEVIGETLGISKKKIITKVLVPNSISTLVEMFSYFFLNSMITISAVAFLCTYSNQPLSILITSYEKNSNYEMQSVISLIILVLNVVFRIVFMYLSKRIKEKTNTEQDGINEINRYQFEMLRYIERKGEHMYNKRELSDQLTLSLDTTNRVVNELEKQGYISFFANGHICISEKGMKALEPYRVRKAIILAAGFGSRLAPVTLDVPKPMVVVNGVRIIDTLLDALIANGITNIYLVRGYMKDQFDVIREKYPFIHFIDNPFYNETNNISSAMAAIEKMDHCYICEADLLISNPEVINKYEYRSNYLGAKVAETDDWCFKGRNGYATEYQRGGENCYQAYGISYWAGEEADHLKEDLPKVYNSRAGKENLWEMVPLRIYKKNYHLEIRRCNKSDIIEIDNFTELIAADESYANYPGHENFR